MQVEEDPLGASGAELVGQLGMVAARPRPAADLAERGIVDADDDDVAARLVRVKAVAAGAKHVFGDLAEAEQAEDQPGKRRPQQQPPAARPLFRGTGSVLRVHVLLPCAQKGYEIGNRVG